MQNLTLYEFKLLSDTKQYDIVFTKGQFLTYHLEGTTRYALYAVNKFFVEVEYNTTTNKIVNKVSFKGGGKLDRYSNLDSFI